MGLPETLKILRKEKKLTQKQLAAELKLPYRTVLNWELGTRMPGYDNMIKLQTFFNVSGDFLLGHTEHRSYEPEDKKLINAVNDELTTLITNIFKAAESSSSSSEHYTFTIMSELYHILKMENEIQKENILNTLKNNTVAISHFADIYNSTKKIDALEIGRLIQAKEDTLQNISDSFEFLINELKVLNDL